MASTKPHNTPAPDRLDDVLLQLNAEVLAEAEEHPERWLFGDLEAGRILDGVIHCRRQGQFARICQDLGLAPYQGAELAKRVRWIG